MKLGRLLLRAVIGGLFIGHGTQKLFGWFNGPGPGGTEQMMEHLELRPANVNARLAGLTETTCGTMLAAGLATPAAAVGLIGTMITAIRTVHLPKGLWVTNGGYEYNLVLIAALASLIDGGPGEISVDRLLGWHDTGPAWALAAIGTGAAASVLTVAAGRRPAVRPAAESADSDAAPLRRRPSAA